MLTQFAGDRNLMVLSGVFGKSAYKTISFLVSLLGVCPEFLPKVVEFYKNDLILLVNNTSHASLRCAPWEVSFFWGGKNVV